MKKPTVQKRKRPEEGGPSRRSRRLEQVQSKNSLGNHVHEGGEDGEDFGERDEGNSSSGEKSGENLEHTSRNPNSWFSSCGHHCNVFLKRIVVHE